MTHQLIRRVVALLLAAAFVVPASAAFATERGAALTATGTTTMMEGEQRIAVGRQGERVVIAGENFRFNELVGVWATLPTGVVRGLDEENIRADLNGDFVVELMLDGSFPTGLHHVTARGKTSGRGAIVPLYLMAGGAGAAAGTEMRLVPPSARQLESVELYASGFAPHENVTLWLTRPDGAVMGLGVERASVNGRLALDVNLPGTLPVGQYAFSAWGNTSSNKAVAPFTLLAGDGMAGSGELTAHFGSFQQRTTIEVSGASFRSNESVTLWLTKPNGAVVALGDQRADVHGNLDATSYLSEALPVGRYHLSYRANSSGAVRIATLVLEPGPQNPGRE